MWFKYINVILLKYEIRSIWPGTSGSNHIAPNCFKNFSELAFTLAGGFMLSDFLKFAIAFFESPFVTYASPRLSKQFALLGNRFVLSVKTSMALSILPLFIN